MDNKFDDIHDKVSLAMQQVTSIDFARCPQCSTGKTVVITRIAAAFYLDTSQREKAAQQELYKSQPLLQARCRTCVTRLSNFMLAIKIPTRYIHSTE